MNYRILPPEEILETTVTLPLSKSVSARVLVMQALTAGARPVPVAALADCDDTRVLAAALTRTTGELDVDDCGTAMRFLTAYYAAVPGTDVTLTGSARLSERPIAPLVDALRSLGADITYTATEGRLPLHIRGTRLRGGAVRLDARASSQFASALAMIAPLADGGLDIDLGGEIASMPYLRMTMRMLANRGVEADIAGYTLSVRGTYRVAEPEIEHDWSAASYWYSIAAVTAGWVTLVGMSDDSLQGDSVLARIGDRFGVLTEFTYDGAELSATPDIWSRLDMDMGDWPDLVPALAVTACLAGLPFTFTGLANLRHKESDRIAALAEGLAKIGCPCNTMPDGIAWDGRREPIFDMPVIDPHADHRIAMAFAAVSVFVPGIIINDIEAVAKSYPGFWDDLRAAGFTLTDADIEMPDVTEEA
ncbi:MAG: 3-phosphoshikimate 1-carboxyvinyltransferase [Bacteroidales bacterium]|nr:3-phosphoshikimate 1-carboxyvinyltransferase [Bacteroidales bacterium]